MVRTADHCGPSGERPIKPSRHGRKVIAQPPYNPLAATERLGFSGPSPGPATQDPEGTSRQRA